jgi:hypothetical protein
MAMPLKSLTHRAIPQSSRYGGVRYSCFNAVKSDTAAHRCTSAHGPERHTVFRIVAGKAQKIFGGRQALPISIYAYERNA